MGNLAFADQRAKSCQPAHRSSSGCGFPKYGVRNNYRYHFELFVEVYDTIAVLGIQGHTLGNCSGFCGTRAVLDAEVQDSDKSC